MHPQPLSAHNLDKFHNPVGLRRPVLALGLREPPRNLLIECWKRHIFQQEDVWIKPTQEEAQDLGMLFCIFQRFARIVLDQIVAW